MSLSDSKKRCGDVAMAAVIREVQNATDGQSTKFKRTVKARS